MKKTIALILAMLLLLSMTACGAENNSQSYSEPYETGTYEPEPETAEYESPEESESPDDTINPDTTEDIPEEVVPTLADMALTNFSFYSDGVAWATSLDADGQERTHAVDEAGNILFTLEEQPFYTSDFYDGVAFYRVSLKGQYSYSDSNKNEYLCYEVIVDKQGNELYRTEFDDQNQTWEHIFGFDDGRFLVVQYTSGITEADYSFSVMDTHCETISGPVAGKQLFASNENGFGKDSRSDYCSYRFLGENSLEYFGEGWYSLFCDGGVYHTFNLDTVRWFDGVVPVIPFENGTAVVAWSQGERTRVDPDYVVKCDTNMNVLEEYDGNSDVIEDISAVRDGIIRNYGKDADSEVWFTDLSGNTVIDLSDLYPDNRKDATSFQNGYAILSIIGADNNKYVTVIDSSGTPLFEPMKCGVSHNGFELVNRLVFANGEPYLLMYDLNTELGLYDMSGTLLHNISADWETYEKINNRNEFEVTVQDGIVRLQYDERFKELSSDDTTLYKVFPLSDWIEAGSDIYELEFIDPFEAPSTVSAETGTDTSSKEYVTLSDFTIEGKWKSVGDYGFGQAQPGAIVVFDGSNCNFFSPSDTYAFYEEDSEYYLDVTSFMSTDTLTFTIKTVDSDHIDVFYGGQVTELRRMD